MGLRKKAIAQAQANNDAGGAIGILVAFGLIVMGIVLSAGLVMPSATRLLGFEPPSSAGADLAVISAALSTVVVALAAFRPSRQMNQTDQPNVGTTVTTTTPAVTTTTATRAPEPGLTVGSAQIMQGPGEPTEPPTDPTDSAYWFDTARQNITHRWNPDKQAWAPRRPPATP